MELTIIIVNWNTREYLRNCIQSVVEYPPAGSYEVIVVDNASGDGSANMVREQFPRVILIENGENVGFARANNQAMRQAHGRSVLLLNSDTLVKPGALTRLVQYLDMHADAGAVGAHILNPDGSLQFSCSPAPTLGGEARRLLHLPGARADGYYPMDRWDLSREQRVDVLLGACLLIRSKALEQTGLMDESFFMYSEEVDLCRRIQQAGWSLYWVPGAHVVHFGGQSTQQAAGEMFLRLYQSKVMYFRKHYGNASSLMYKLLLAVISIFRLGLGILAWFEPADRKTRHKTVADNYRRLLLALPGI